MKNAIFYALCVVFFSTNVFSQTLQIGGSGKTLQQMKNNAVLGTPYFNDSFLSSVITTYSSKELNISQLRYDIYVQNIEYLYNDKVYLIQDSVKSFTATDSTGKSHVFVKKRLSKKDSFFQILATGKIGLLKQYQAKLVSAEDWYTKKQTKTFVHEVIYYTGKGENLEKLNTSRKGLTALFSDKIAAVNEFIEKNKTDLKTDEGLVSLFQFYNGLN